MPSEQEKFLQDLEIDNSKNVLDDAIEEVKPENGDPEDAEFKAKNRRERRLLEKNQQLREEAIAATARLQGIEESRTIRKDAEPANYLKRIEKIYGNATPEAKEATELLLEALRGVEESATQKALEKFELQRGSESQAIREEEKNLDKMSDTWEDEYDIDMSNEATRKAIFSLTEKLSPKDADGNIKEYADPDAVAEVFLSTREKSNSRAKELASRSMTRSGSSQPSKLEQDATWKALKEAGIF